MKTITAAEIHRHTSYDQRGYVFRWRDQIYRAIYPSFEFEVRELWDCGLIDALMDAGLLPKSEITDFQTDDCSLVIAHETVHVETLPSEWSFTMLRDAALITLRVNIIARVHGYQTVDAHGFNVLFHGSKPLFIDIGSFIKLHNDFGCAKPGWRPYGEFKRSFYAPLKLWSEDSEFIARRALMGEQLPMCEFWRLRYPVLRLIPLGALGTFEELYYRYKGLNTVSMDEFRRFVSRSPARQRWGERIIRFANRRSLPFASVNLEKLEKQVSRLKTPSRSSAWADYHSDRGLDNRFNYILNVIEQYQPQSVLDMAGNAGFLTRRIVENAEIGYAICADYDRNAIDTLYKSLDQQELRLYPAVLDFSISVSDSKFRPSHERFKSDMVMALALTHHLLLTQGLTLDFILERLSQYSNRYVLVEFMPMGLYSSKFDHIPIAPDWYTRDWFRSGLEERFDILDERELATNRVLYVAEKRAK